MDRFNNEGQQNQQNRPNPQNQQRAPYQNQQRANQQGQGQGRQFPPNQNRQQYPPRPNPNPNQNPSNASPAPKEAYDPRNIFGLNKPKNLVIPPVIPTGNVKPANVKTNTSNASVSTSKVNASTTTTTNGAAGTVGTAGTAGATSWWNNSFLSAEHNWITYIVIIIAIIALITILVSIYNTIRNTKLQNTTFLTVPTKPSADYMTRLQGEYPEMKNGREFTYSYWIYIDDLDAVTKHKLVLARGPESSEQELSWGDANFISFIEKNTNKLTIKLKTEYGVAKGVQIDKGIGGNVKTTDGINRGTFIEDKCLFTEVGIDYLPLQRWINIVLTVKNDIITLFMDGDIKNTKALQNTDTACPEATANIITKGSGSLFMGSSALNELTTFNGIISNVHFFNYSISLDEISALYKAGPAPLAVKALPYRIRNPLYRIDDIVAAKTT